MFTTGGIVQEGFCKHLIDYDTTAQEFEKLVRNHINEGGDSINLTIRELLDDCKEDKSLYTAFNIADNGFNISEYLDLDDTQLPVVIEEFKNITFNIDPVTVITPEINTTMFAIEKGMNEIDFEEYENQLSKDVTVLSVYEYSSRLSDLAEQLRDDDPNLADDLQTEATELELVYNTTIVDMEMKQEELSKATEACLHISSSIELSDTMDELTNAQIIIESQSDQILQDIIGDMADGIYGKLDNLTDTIIYAFEEDVAKCYPVYDVVTTIVYAPCVYVLYPFNALWFCYGWFIVLAALLIFVATSLANMIQIDIESSKSEHGAYVGNMNDIPLPVQDYDNAGYIGYVPPPDYKLAPKSRKI